jgi:hypothetical protein
MNEAELLFEDPKERVLLEADPGYEGAVPFLCGYVPFEEPG